MNYWVVSACYPQGNFYPLSDGNSIFYRLITMPCFRTSPPLHFGRRPPQSNCPSDIVLLPDNGSKLEFKKSKGGIPRLTPYKLASIHQRLPPILYINFLNSVSNYSKAPWGLSVLSRVTCIFTGIKISPSLLVETAPKSLRLSCGSEFA
jgi:hypothetical protein